MLNRIDKGNILFVGLILVLSLVFLHNIISTTKIMTNVHHINDVTFVSQNIKESLFKFKSLNLWTPYYYSGQPLYAQPEYYFLDINFLYIILFRNIFIAMNLATITYFFLSGLGMYFLFLAFSANKRSAFIAAVLYMFNGYMHTFVITGNLNVLAGYSLIPFAFLFFVKALQSENIIKNAIFSGLFVAFQIFAGGVLLIPYEMILFFVYGLFYVIQKDIKKSLLRLAIVGIIIALVGFAVSAVKLLPAKEFMDLSNRSSGVSYEEYLGYPISLSNIVRILVTTFVSSGTTTAVGIMGFILLIFGLYNYKKRYVLFALFTIVLALLMAIKGPVADLFFKLPAFSQLRHIERAVFMIAFASPLIAGSGFMVFSEKLSKRKKINDVAIFAAVVALILIEVLLLQPFPKSLPVTNPKDIAIENYISKDTGKFRTINLALSTLVGASGYNYLSQLGIGTIKGGSGIWFNDYLTYLAIGQQTNPTKFWGLLNDKYVISDKELALPGLKFVSKFEECKDCVIWEAYGPYLYENLDFMPRAYIVDDAFLVIGPEENAKRIIYSLIADNNFDPKKSVIIQGKGSVSQYNLGELKKYKVIILLQQIDQLEVNILREFVDSGGILLPKIFDGKNTINQDEIENLFRSLNKTFAEVDISIYENNKAVYDTSNKKGFLVLSERFSNFPGWKTIGNDEKEILKANAITTAVFVDNDDKITFKYSPSSFRNGAMISIIASIMIMVYFIYNGLKSGGKNKN